MWDAGQGLYFDYNFEHRFVRKYAFLTPSTRYGQESRAQTKRRE
jgi:hypothetical protein